MNLRVLVVLALLASGCTSVTPGRAGPSASIFLGATSVRLPQTRGDISAVAVRSLGPRLGTGGLYLGWRAGDWIAPIPPIANCSSSSARPSVGKAVRIINALEGQHPCIVDYTHTLRR